MKPFDGKVAFVSGGSRGIGRACCLELARRGAAVVVGYLGNEGRARDTVGEIEALGAKATAIGFDAGDPEACERAIAAALEALGRVDVLVNNAGIHHDALALRTKPADWDRQFAVNVGGAFHLSRAVCRAMMKGGGGAIVNVSSIVGEMGNPGQSAYSASKAALLGLTKTLARELASRNIRVNAVSPGFVETDMTADLDEAARKHWLERIPLARLARAEEIARAVAFLASDDASYVTGEVLRVNGGLLM